MMAKLYQGGYGRYMTTERATQLLNKLLTLTADDVDNMLFSEYVDYCKAVEMATSALRKTAEGKGAK